MVIKMNFVALYLLAVLAVFRCSAASYNAKQCHSMKAGESCLSVNVTAIIDGTHVEVTIKNLESLGLFRVRLLGIKGPALNDTFGQKAKEHLGRLIRNKRLLLIIRSANNMPGKATGTFYARKVDINKLVC